MSAYHALVALVVAGCFAGQSMPAAALAKRVAVTSQDDASISEIDVGTGRIVTRVGVGRGPAALAASPDGHEIFVTHPDGSVIDVVDAIGGHIIRQLHYGGEAFGVAAGPGALYVSDWSKDIVTRLDPVTGLATATVAVGKSPAGLVIDLIHHRLYAADRESGDVTVITSDSMERIAAIATGASPFALALSPDGDRLYVANVRSNDLAVIDTAHLRRVATVPAGAMPYGVAVTPDGESILVTNQHGSTLSIIDAKSLSIVATVPVGRYPEGVIVAGGQAYVANWFSGDVSVIDLAQRREITRIKVGDGPRNFTLLSEPTRGP